MLSDSFNRDVEIGARAQRGQTGMNDTDIALMEQQLFGSGSSSDGNNRQINMIQIQEEKYEPNYANLPPGIRESFMQKAPLQYDNSADLNPLNEIDKKLNVKKGSINEVKQKQIMENLPSNGTIDYSIIKMIVDECVKRNLSEMGKGMLTEGKNSDTFRGMIFKPNNVIQFLDKKGNLYEGVFKLKKKAQS